MESKVEGLTCGADVYVEKPFSIKQLHMQIENLLKLRPVSYTHLQIEERKRYIMAINNDVEAIQRELALLERQLHGLEKDLKDKKKKY